MINEATPEQTAAGDQVKAAQAAVDAALGEINDKKGVVAAWRSNKADMSVELEMLNDRDDDTLTIDMRHRKLDLQKDIEALGLNIDRIKSTADLDHKLQLANVTLNKKRQGYNDLMNPSKTGVLNNVDIAYLKSLPPRTKMSEKQRTAVIARYGMDNYMKHCEMV